VSTSHSRVIAAALDQMFERRASNAAAGRRRQRSGVVGQSVIELRLRALGVLMLEAVNTPWKIVRVGGRIVGAVPMKKVSGDFRGMLPGGRSVLVEVKSFGRLPYGAFKAHQVQSLADHHASGGLSLVGWVFPGGDVLMAWPIPGFLPRTSVSVERAKALNVVAIPR